MRRTLPGPYTLEQAVADVLGTTAQLGIERFALVGHSMGAQVAELIAREVPERVISLTLMTPTPLAGNRPHEVRTFLRESGSDPHAQRDIRALFSRNLSDVHRGLHLSAYGRILEAMTVRGV
jgi:pimeloyl-ACP methyl ester carboxylesterase